jgi:hypothetical protein
MINRIDHIPNIRSAGFGQKRLPCTAALLLLAACSSAGVAESSSAAVTVRYTAMDGIAEAKLLAEKACAVHHKAARLRSTANFGLTDRYAHFDCV